MSPDPDGGPSVDVPIQTLDAGPDPFPGPAEERELPRRLASSMKAVRSAVEADRVVLALLDLACGLVTADAVILELRGPAGRSVPWIVAHRGLHPDEQARLEDGAWRESGPARLPHRISMALTGARARPGRLTFWRAEGPFDPADEERAELAATSIEALLHQFLRRRKGQQRRRWTAVADVFVDAVVASEPVAGVLQLIVDQVREVSECDVAWLATGSADRPRLRVVSAARTPQGVDATHLVERDLGFSLSNGVIASGEPLRVTDLARATTAVPMSPPTPFGPALVQPVLVDGACVGALGLAWLAERSSSYLSLDPTLPGSFAGRTALAMRLGRARGDAERLAVLEERHRIRMDLHDRVVQRLYALGMALETARLREDPARVGELLTHAVERVDETIAEIRRTIAGLSLADEGMTVYDAMTAVLDKAEIAAPFRPELRVHGLSSVPMPPDLVEDLLSVLEEAVSNVVRHAQATRCRVSLVVDDQVTLSVEDDGVGVPEGVPRSGLANIARRAESHGGAIALTGLDPGTRLSWSVPRPATP